MHGTQITTTDTISATMPLKVSVATRTSTIPESFSIRWRRDILAANASGSERSLTTPKATSRGTVPTELTPILKADTNSSKSASTGMVATVTQATQRSSVSGAAPNAAARLDGRIAERRAADAAGGGKAVPVGTPASPRSSRELKATAPASIAGIVKPEDASSFTVAVVTTPGVHGNVPATSDGIEVPQNLANNPAQATSDVPSAIKLSRPSANGLSGKEASAKPGPAGEVLASGPSSHTTVMSEVSSKNPAGAGAATVVSTTSSAGGSSNSEGVSPIASVSHLNQIGSLSAVSQTMALNPAALPSARADLHLRATNVADTAGIGTIHVLPSGPAQLDVGVLDGTHGWLRIRAELGAGGSVSASLTAHGVADESLRASLPEMVKYLGLEGVAVSSLAVHRFSESEDANPMPASTSEGQLNGNTQGHRPGGGEQRDGTGTQEDQSEATDRLSTRSTSAITNSLAGLDPADAEVPSGWNQGLSRSTPGLFWPSGAFGDGSGSWLNVRA